MAINIDHTNSANITLRGPDNANPNDSYKFIFPNVNNTDTEFLLSGESPIGSISGLTTALSNKVEKSTTGSAAGYDVGTTAGTLPVLDNNGYIPAALIPAVAIKDVFKVNTSGDLVGLSAASIGDVAIATGTKLNYILSSSGASAYSNISNWVEIKFPEQKVLSVNGLDGDVTLDGSNVYLTNGHYALENFDDAIEDLYQTKANLSSLVCYTTTGYVATCLDLYEKISDFNDSMSGYVQCADFTSCISDYSTTSEISGCLSSYYVPKTETGNSAGLSYGTTSGCLVRLGADGKIDHALVPSAAITDTFIIADTGELIGLTAQKGDIAIVTGETKANYILRGSNAAQIADWTALAASLGAVRCVNGVEPVNGNITITSSGINVSDSAYFDGETISFALNCLRSELDIISGNYLTTGAASGLLVNYVLTGTATGALDTKSDVSHEHEMSNISGLTGCLDSITTFFTGAGAYSATQNGVNPGMNEATASYSVALGYGAKAVQDYEIAHAAGWFNNVGDAQASKLISKCYTSDDTLTEIARIEMDTNTNILFSAYVVGKTSSSYAAFKVEGAASKAATNASVTMLDNSSVTTFANKDSLYFVDSCVDTMGGALVLAVSGDSANQMNWVSDITVVKVKTN